MSHIRFYLLSFSISPFPLPIGYKEFIAYTINALFKVFWECQRHKFDRGHRNMLSV